MSKTVKEHILAVAKTTAKRGEAEQEFLKRCLENSADPAKTSDEEWNSLSEDAQSWFNVAVDRMNEGKAIPAFPEEAEEKPTTTRTRGAKQEAAPAQDTESVVGTEVKVTTARGKEVIGTITEIDEESMLVTDAEGQEHEFDRARVKSVEFIHAEEKGEDYVPAVNDSVVIVTTRGKTIEGTVVEVDDEVVVLDTGTGEDTEVSRTRIETITLKGSGKQDTDGDEVPVVGDKVEVVTKRGKEVNGTVVEIDGDALVIGLADGQEIEVDSSTAQSIKVVKATAEKATRTPTREGGVVSRGGTAQTQTAKTDDKARKITKKDNGGVSVAARMREIICAEPDISMDEVTKQLKAEKLEYKEATLDINFKLVTGVIALLKQSKHYK